MAAGSLLRYTVHYSGRVQGVGFRYAAREVARGRPVGGYVQNLDDGRVRLVAEGEPAALDAFLAAVAARMRGHIRDEVRVSEPATGEFADGTGAEAFRIRHG